MERNEGKGLWISEADPQHTQFHPGMKDQAKYYTFMPCLCRPYRAKTKGKGKRGIDYIRRTFFVPRTSRCGSWAANWSLPHKTSSSPGGWR